MEFEFKNIWKTTDVPSMLIRDRVAQLHSAKVSNQLCLFFVTYVTGKIFSTVTPSSDWKG